LLCLLKIFTIIRSELRHYFSLVPSLRYCYQHAINCEWQQIAVKISSLRVINRCWHLPWICHLWN